MPLVKNGKLIINRVLDSKWIKQNKQKNVFTRKRIKSDQINKVKSQDGEAL